MRIAKELAKARSLLNREFSVRAQHTACNVESASTRKTDQAFERYQQGCAGNPASSRVPWGPGYVITATSFTFTGIGWALNNLSQSETFKNVDLSDLWKAPANSFIGPYSWLSGEKVSSGVGHNFLADAAAKAMPAVVNINHAFTSEQEPGEQACGSGFVVDASGLIATNAHVVEAALERQQLDKRRGSEPPLQIVLQDGRSFRGEVLSIDRVSDLALVKIDAQGPLPTVKMGSSRGMRVGEWVLALGSPLTLQNSVTAGIVSCVGRQAKELGLPGKTGYIQTDAAINSGNSGGPLVNLAGEVVGISTMKALFSSGVSFAIPIDAAREIMSQMQQQGRVVRPYVGIKMLELNEQNTSQMHQKNSKFPTLSSGVLVPGVLDGSPASKAGLRQGDIIVGFSGSNKDVTVPALVEVLTQNIGKRLQLQVLRGDQELALSIRAIEARNDYPEAQ